MVKNTEPCKLTKWKMIVSKEEYIWKQMMVMDGSLQCAIVPRMSKFHLSARKVTGVEGRTLGYS